MAAKRNPHQYLPTTLMEAVRYFADPEVATQFVARLRWPDGFVCPNCGGKKFSYLTTRRLWKCKECRKQTSVKKDTIFEDSPLTLDKWLVAMWMVANCKNGISSHELARATGITQKSGWFLLHRIRLAMQTGTFRKLSGEIEVDESYIGGAARYMHQTRRQEKFGTAPAPKNPHGHKTMVLGFRERGGEVRAQVINSLHSDTVQPRIREHVQAGSAIYSDKMGGYIGIDAYNEYEHGVVDHAVRYVDGQVHTNGIENFWSLLKRGLKGTYISVEPFHLFRYLDEQVFRYNRRGGSDAERFLQLLARIAGRRVTWVELTGKV